MKKEQRQPYLILTEVELPPPFNGTLGLCHFCKYAQWSGSSCCEDGDLECTCGIWKIEDGCWDIWAGGDCWVFRPLYAHEDCVDMVGIWLQGQWPDMTDVPERRREQLSVVLRR